MGIFNSLGAFCLRQVVAGVSNALGVGFAAEAVSRVGVFLNQHFADGSLELDAALKAAGQRTWKSLELALAGETLWSMLTTDKSEKVFREQIRRFLDHCPLPAEATQS